MKQVLPLIGKILLALAFVSGIAELAAHGLSNELSWIPSSGDVWAVLAPDRLDAFLARHPAAIWQTLLSIPAWSLFGIPGFILVFAFHNKTAGDDPELEHSLFLYDELNKQLERGDYEDFGDTENRLQQADMDPGKVSAISFAEEGYSESVLDQALASKHDYLFKNKD